MGRKLCIYIYMYPVESMYGIFTYISHKNQPNVGKYTIITWILWVYLVDKCCHRHWRHWTSLWWHTPACGDNFNEHNDNERCPLSSRTEQVGTHFIPQSPTHVDIQCMLLKLGSKLHLELSA